MFSWAFTKIPCGEINELGEEIERLVINLVLNPGFKDAITYSTNSTIQVGMRFDMVEQTLGPYMVEEHPMFNQLGVRS